MIVVKTTLDVLPEKRLEVLQTLVSLIAAEKEEADCISYSAHCDISNQNRFTLLGEWDSTTSLHHHIRSFRFGVLLGIKPLLSDPIKIQIHAVSSTRGMEMIHAARKDKP